MVLESPNNQYSLRKTLTKTDCLNAVSESLTSHLPIQIQGSLTAKQLFTQITCLATNNQSIHSASKLFPGFRSPTSLHHHLNKFTMESLISASSDLLMEHVKEHIIPDKEYECAIDFTGDPYYGKIGIDNEKYVVKGQRKKSTYKFYTYITLSIVEKNEKFILGALPVERGYVTVDLVQGLLKVFDKYRIKPKVIYMDGGFYGLDLMKFLIEKNIPFVIPAPNKRGRLRDKIENTKRTHRYQYNVGNYPTNYAQVTLGVIIKRIKEDSKQKKDRIAYVIYGLDTWSLGKIAEKYIHRFSIEASYRMRNQIKPRTTTKNAVIRYLFALISFLIENVWVSFQITFFTKKKEECNVIEKKKFPLNKFVTLINVALREILGQITEVEIITEREIN